MANTQNKKTLLQDLTKRHAENEELTPLELAVVVFGMESAAEELAALRRKNEQANALLMNSMQDSLSVMAATSNLLQKLGAPK